MAIGNGVTGNGDAVVFCQFAYRIGRVGILSSKYSVPIHETGRFAESMPDSAF
jgi:hypothetical protein